MSAVYRIEAHISGDPFNTQGRGKRLGGGTRNLVPMTAGDFEKEVKVIEAYWYSGVSRETPLRNIPTKFETI